MISAICRRIATVGLAAVVLVVAAPPAAHGFCPNNGWRCGFGLAGTTHKDITVDAVKALDQELFGTSKLTKGMKKAIEEIWQANSDVDLIQTESARHFDGENFDGSKTRVINLRNDVVSALQSENGTGARQALGAALHTLQDFYAHSNFIERGGSGAYSAIWDPAVPISPIVGLTTPNCRDCDLIPLPDGSIFEDCSSNIINNDFTTGYYGGEPDAIPKVAGKCRHGGITDKGPGPLGGINKDTLFETFSPHNFEHGAAAAAAKEGSKQLIRDIAGQITRRQLKLLLGVGPTLAMAIDTTGSMGGVIASVRSQAIAIVNARLDTDQEPIQYVLSPFNDPFVGPLTVTDDPNVFKSAISSLFASGGGDCPELSMTGSQQALSAADEGVDLFTFTDADAKDAGLAGSVASLEASKDADVYPMLFGFCSFLTSSLTSDQASAATNFTAVSDLATLPIDPAYERIASAGGGQLFFLNSFEAGQITNLADAVVRADSVDLLSVADSYGTADKVYSVPVDSTLSRVTFSLSGSTSLTLTRPDGSVVGAADPGVQHIALSTGSIYTILTPASGDWTAATNGTGTFTLRVLGESPVSFDRFDFVEVRAQGGHEGYFKIEGFPVTGESDVASAELTGGFSVVDFDFRDRAANVLQSFTLGQEAGGSPDEYYGTVALPTQPFAVYATGTLDNGERFQRMLTKTVEPQSVRVFAPLAHDLAPGGTALYRFTVKNFGAPNAFILKASDNRGFVTGVSATSFSLNTDQSVDVTVQLTVPPGSPTGITDTLTVAVESVAPAGARNFAVVESPVVEKAIVFVACEDAVPSVSTLWPPTHGSVPVGIQGVTASDGSLVVITVDAIAQSESTDAAGDGSTCPDASGIGTATALLKAERSGTGPGRTYAIFFTARTATGGECQSSVTVCVPHDQGGGCSDQPTGFDSTVCN
jgi:hypothetical protein